MDWALFGLFLAAGLLVAAAPGSTVLQIFAQSMPGDPRRPAGLIADIGYALSGLALANLSSSRRAVMLKNRFTGSVLVGAALSPLRVGRG